MIYTTRFGHARSSPLGTVVKQKSRARFRVGSFSYRIERADSQKKWPGSLCDPGHHTFPKELLHRRLVLRAPGAATADDDRHAAETREQILQARRQTVHLIAGFRQAAEEARQRVIGVGKHPARTEVERHADLLQIRELELDLVVHERSERFDLDGHVRQEARGLGVDAFPGLTLIIENLDLLVVVLDQGEPERHHALRRLVGDDADFDVVRALVGLLGGVDVEIDTVHALKERGEDRDVARFGLIGSRGLGHVSLPFEVSVVLERTCSGHRSTYIIARIEIKVKMQHSYIRIERYK